MRVSVLCGCALFLCSGPALFFLRSVDRCSLFERVDSKTQFVSIAHGVEFDERDLEPRCEFVHVSDKAQGLLCDGEFFVHHTQLERVKDGGLSKPLSARWWASLFMTCLCVCLAALAAGLTMGFNGLDEEDLLRIIRMREEDLKFEVPEELLTREVEQLKKNQQHAEAIHSVVSKQWMAKSYCGGTLNPSNHHYVLVTLLLLNACANEAMPVFLQCVLPDWLAVVFSITLVLCFGEIFPSAIFTGRHQLAIAAFFTPFVKTVKFAFAPIVYPISVILDWLLGHDVDSHPRFEKAHIKTLARNQLGADEVKKIEGVLELAHKKVDDSSVMTPLSQVEMLEIGERLTQERVRSLMVKGFSRVPVFAKERRDVRGMVLVADILRILTENGGQFDAIGSVAEHTNLNRPMLVMSRDTNLLDAINLFQMGRHLALVCSSPDTVSRAWREGSAIPTECKVLGIVTLEEVIEEMLQEDIKDEADMDIEEQRGARFKTFFNAPHLVSPVRSLVQRSLSSYLTEPLVPRRLRSAPFLDMT
mmetsp:Transcript_129/g.457  ORF Transcript_129/g.457 Transcript_129/m.457 type:complete len:531 (-) Transcript_129:221-1813(-)|eukprot:CAMPEP_0194518062 /NCGR_PEP_ID=MMETSP0253-20130528/51384_1 /TAXON_ID=2966 /ORGANISM="Noctiluca scintillans" /LENGTH=530 /DNA_ID=CAMNT_0039362083 /DNA_START=59 /DNA_END=1651 /DNA_ORIENTATION=-